MAVAVNISPEPILHFLDNNGNAFSGGKLFVYLAATLAKTTTYTDATGTVPAPNPIILNTRGEASVWLQAGQAVKFVLSPSTDSDPPSNSFYTVDQINVGTVASLGANTFIATQTFSPVSGAAIVTAGAINETSQTLASG